VGVISPKALRQPARPAVFTLEGTRKSPIQKGGGTVGSREKGRKHIVGERGKKGASRHRPSSTGREKELCLHIVLKKKKRKKGPRPEPEILLPFLRRKRLGKEPRRQICTRPQKKEKTSLADPKRPRGKSRPRPWGGKKRASSLGGPGKWKKESPEKKCFLGELGSVGDVISPGRQGSRAEGENGKKADGPFSKRSPKKSRTKGKRKKGENDPALE